MKIVKAKETMTARERVARTFSYEKTDRVTIGYESNEEINRKLCQALGVTSQFELLKCLGVDYAGIHPKYNGPSLFPELPDRRRDGQTGAVMRYIPNEYGGYWDFCDFPLKDAEPEAIASFPCASADDYDYDDVKEQVAFLRKEGFAVHLGHPGLGDILNTTGMVMGVEDALVNIATRDEATLQLIDRRLNRDLAVCERVLAKNEIDFMWLGEDLGTQHSPIISIELYREVIRPRQQKFIDLAKSYNMPVIIHTCGASSWVYEDFIEMGMSGVDTLQPEATNMTPKYLTEKFGGRLNFRGCISTAGPLAYRTAAETEQVCIKTLEIMKPHRGYHFAPTHAIQDNTPVENIIAMYNAAHKYGVY